jgi:hypothetical protein
MDEDYPVDQTSPEHLRQNNAGGITNKIFNLNDNEQVWENVKNIKFRRKVVKFLHKIQ